MARAESRRASLQKTIGHSRIEWPIAEIGYNQRLLRLRLSVRIAPLGRCAALLLLGRAVLLLWSGVLLLRRGVLLLRRAALLLRH
jgi:hypothetical protein